MKKKNFTEEEAKTIVKDAITLIMIDEALSGDGDVENIKSNTYAIVAQVIKELNEDVDTVDDLLFESIMCTKARKKISRKMMGDNNEVEI